MVKNRALRTGDGSHKYSKLQQDDAENHIDNNNTNQRDTEHFWGWGELKLYLFEKSFDLTIFSTR